jgi:hypothetical protein
VQSPSLSSFSWYDYLFIPKPVRVYGLLPYTYCCCCYGRLRPKFKLQSSFKLSSNSERLIYHLSSSSSVWVSNICLHISPSFKFPSHPKWQKYVLPPSTVRSTRRTVIATLTGSCLTMQHLDSCSLTLFFINTLHMEQCFLWSCKICWHWCNDLLSLYLKVGIFRSDSNVNNAKFGFC